MDGEAVEEGCQRVAMHVGAVAVMEVGGKWVGRVGCEACGSSGSEEQEDVADGRERWRRRDSRCN